LRLNPEPIALLLLQGNAKICCGGALLQAAYHRMAFGRKAI
jgi:hypothetical protein